MFKCGVVAVVVVVVCCYCVVAGVCLWLGGDVFVVVCGFVLFLLLRVVAVFSECFE